MFLTDGKPTVSETDPDVIRSNVQDTNKYNISIHALALGNDTDMKYDYGFCFSYLCFC